MLGEIIKKEIRNNFFSFRFLVAFALLVAIVAVTVVILTNDYIRKQDEYSQSKIELENYMKKYAHLNRIFSILTSSQPPLPFYSLIRGLSSDVNIEKFDNDPLPVMFPLMDLTFIVTILLSLMALLFSYDSICGEKKEEGNLKLMLANKIARSKVILAKSVGGTLTLLFPFLFSLIVGLLIISLNPRLNWGNSEWGVLALIFLGSFLYFTAFYSIGVLISSRHHSSSASIMTSIFVWVLLALLIPNLSPYAASFFYKIPSKIKVERQLDRMTHQESDSLGRKMERERYKEFLKEHPILAEKLSQAEREKKMAEDSEYRKVYQLWLKESEKAWNRAKQIQQQKAYKIWRENQKKEASQTRLSIHISMVSPLSNLVYLATDLSSTGMRNKFYFERLDLKWHNTLGLYRMRKRASLQKENPDTHWWELINKPIDMSDAPRFQYQQEAFIDRFKESAKFFIALIIFNLIFFSSAYFSFVKYDVR